jgi:hypothetical protein
VGVTPPPGQAALGGGAALVHQATPPIPLGPLTCERAARVLEQGLATVWAAVLESHGHDPAGGWEVHLEGLSLRPVAAPGAAAAAAPAGNGRPP